MNNATCTSNTFPPFYFLTRLIFLFILFLGFQTAGYAQIITTEPEFPTAEDSVSIFYDATEGTAGLQDFDGDVYAHTGVVTDQSTSNSDWRYVITEWPENVPKIKTVRVGENRYRLDITPSIREYYGVPDNEEIEKMAFVFRNSDGTREGKAEGGRDIFADVFADDFNVKFVKPAESPVFRQNNDTLSVFGIASDPNATLSLHINDQVVEEVQNDTLQFVYTIPNEGSYDLRLIGSGNAAGDTASAQLITYPATTDRDRPAGLQDGITYPDDTSVELSLFAPGKEFVFLIGDFNNWQIEPEYAMHRDFVNADSSYFWIEIDGLNPGQEYGFQYLVDGEIRVGDPYAEKILDPNHDPNIPESIYPNLKPYPQEQTQHLVSVLQPGQQPFNWQHSGYDRPEIEELVIYELLVRDFLDQHDYQTLTDTLDYLDRLGINAIELMPVMEFDANSSWGYNPTYHLAADKYYGPAEDLKKFIDEAHSRGMVVLLDMVLNHAWGPSPLVRLWNEGEFGKPTAENPYLNIEPRHDFNVGYDFNHESAATQYFVDRVNAHWLQEFKFDGFRFDLSKGFTQKNTLGDVSAWGQYDASRVKILKRMANAIRAVDDSAYVIMEHFAENREEKELSQNGMMLWGNLNFNYNEAAMGYHSDGKSDFSAISYQERGWEQPHLDGYMESHDEERMMYKNLQFGNSSPDGSYDVTELDTALDRIKLAGAFFFTVPGPKMFWQFGELGYEVSIDENGRTGEKPIKWEYYGQENRLKLYKTFRALIRLRNAHPAFTSDATEITTDVREATKRITLSHPEMEVTIAGNFGVTERSMQPEFAREGRWYNFFSGDSLNISNTDTTMALKAGEFHIFTTQRFEPPEENLLGETEEEPAEPDPSNGEFKLNPNYPNPFSTSTTIQFELDQERDVMLKIYDILGRELAVYDLGTRPAEENEYLLDASSFSSGMYIYVIRAGDKTATRKMMLIK